MFNSKFNKLNDRSKQILSVFTSTVSDLTVLNEDIAVEVGARNTEAARLISLANTEENKASELVASSEYNQRVIDKVTAFLED